MSDADYRPKPSPVPAKPPPTIVGTLWAVAEWVVKRELALRVFSVAALVAVGAGGIVWAQGALDGGAASAVAPVKLEVEHLRADLDAHLKDDRDAKRQTAAVLSELGADIRALYRAQQTGQPQARLERPPQLPDGGP